MESTGQWQLLQILSRPSGRGQWQKQLVWFAKVPEPNVAASSDGTHCTAETGYLLCLTGGDPVTLLALPASFTPAESMSFYLVGYFHACKEVGWFVVWFWVSLVGFFSCGRTKEVSHPKGNWNFEIIKTRVLKQGSGKKLYFSGELCPASIEEWTNTMHSCKSCHYASLDQCFCLQNPWTLTALLLPLPSSHSPLSSLYTGNFATPAWTSKGLVHAQKKNGGQEKMHEILQGGSFSQRTLPTMLFPWGKLPGTQLGHTEKAIVVPSITEFPGRCHCQANKHRRHSLFVTRTVRCDSCSATTLASIQRLEWEKLLWGFP